MGKEEIVKIIKTTTKEYDDNTVTTETKVIEGENISVIPKVIKYDRLTKKKANERKVIRKIDTKRVEYSDGSYNLTTKAYNFGDDGTRNLVVDTYEFNK